MPMVDRRTIPWLSAVLLTVALAAAGCGGDDGGSAARRGSGGEPSGSTSEHTDTDTAPATVPARPSAGCGTPPAVSATDEEPGDVALTLASGGQERTYRLGIPAAYDPDVASPLVMNLHGANSGAVANSISTDMPRKAGARGFITIAPDARDGKWEGTGSGADDDFLMALLDEVTARYCVDLDRVHLAGMSLGAWKAALTACQHPDRIASIALVTVEVHPGCAMPVVAFHGTADTVVPYGEGADPGVVVTNANAGLPGARANIASWAKAAGCSDAKKVLHPGDDIELWTYQGCPDGKDVSLYTMLHAGHVWPGSKIELEGATDTIDATEIALDWFQAHPMRP